MRAKRKSRPTNKPRRGQPLRATPHMILIPTALLIAGAIIATLVRFEKDLPPLLADELPKADAVRVDKGARRLSLIRGGTMWV